MDKEDLKKAMQEAQNMQIDLIKAQSELAHAEIKGTSHNTKVKVTMTGEGEFRSVKIEPALLAEGLTALETSMLEALKDVSNQAAQMTKARLAEISKAIDL